LEVAGSSTKTSTAAPATCPLSSPARQRRLVDKPAASAVDDAHARLHAGDRVGVDDVTGLVGQRGVQRDEVGAAEERLELDLLDAKLHGAVLRQERVEGDHRIARPCALSATTEPILPQPITPSTLPVISTPMNRVFSHFPAWVE
jgi:hypothetical protein